MRKETHNVDGVKEVKITTDGGEIPPSVIPSMPGEIDGVLKSLLDDMAKNGGGSGTVRITTRIGGIGGNTVITKKVVSMGGSNNSENKTEAAKDHEDDDDEGIPPEILQMMMMTQSLLGGGLFRPPGLMMQKKEENLGPRHEESMEEIM
jgi:hypothetical protein